ncbi:MAG: hypothetical protein ACFB21_13770 [Opitutales bacterium]
MKMLFGTLGGVAAALVGAVIWAVITVTTEFQIGFMAIGVGLLCGLAVGALGGENGPAKGFVGAATSLLGCVLGNLFSGIGLIAKAEGIPYLELFANFNWAASGEVLGLMFSPIDLLFYAIALFQGYKLAANFGQPGEA